jgi:hypothetical protein
MDTDEIAIRELGEGMRIFTAETQRNAEIRQNDGGEKLTTQGGRALAVGPSAELGVCRQGLQILGHCAQHRPNAASRRPMESIDERAA